MNLREKPQQVEKTNNPVLDSYKKNFESGEWKVMNIEPIHLSKEEYKLISDGEPDSQEVQNLLKEKNILIGKGYFYKIDDTLVSFDPEDMGTALYSDLVKELNM